jgi:exodeoxyribonuclease V gamma subunit
LSGPLPDVAVDLAIGDFRIIGRLTRIDQQAMIAFRPGKLKAKDLIRAWIRHLCLNSVAGDNPRQTLLIATDRDIRLQPVKAAAAILGSLLELYWLGLSQPLAFFPQTSCKLVEALYKQDDLEAGLLKAQKVWEGSSGLAGEAADPYHELCYGDVACLDDVFVTQAKVFFAPLFEHL